jgi:hypothetical protein
LASEQLLKGVPLLGSFSTKLPLVFVTHLHLDIHKCSARQVEPAKTAFGTEMLKPSVHDRGCKVSPGLPLLPLLLLQSLLCSSFLGLKLGCSSFLLSLELTAVLL